MPEFQGAYGLLNSVIAMIGQHDPARIGYALLICLASSLAAAALLVHLQTDRTHRPRLWLAGAAITAGFGIWATHFVAILGLRITGDSGFRVEFTLASLVLIVVGLYVAFAGLTYSKARTSRLVYGALIGLSISAMHYMGMAGFVPEAAIHWNLGLAAFSVIAGMGLGAASGLVFSHARGLKCRLTFAALLASTVLAVHFIGMAAYTMVPICRFAEPAQLLPSVWLDRAIVGSVMLIVAMTYVVLAIDGRDRAMREEVRHMSELANATIEALMICDGDRISAINRNLAVLVGREEKEILGLRIDDILKIRPQARKALLDNQRIETAIRSVNGAEIVVEVLAHDVSYAGRQQTAIAILDISARKAAENEIRHLANYDVLTQLPNRNRFYQFLSEQLQEAQAWDTRLALICIDLDHFKDVNDFHGHKVGDEFLQRAVAVMTGVLKEGQILGRIGGDEFGLLLPAIGIPENAGKVAQDILAAFAEDNKKVGKSTSLSASLGISIYPDDALTKADLLTAADAAMYRAKQEGRNTFRFFDAGMADDMRERHFLEQELRQAVHNEEFHLLYQPQADCRSGEVVGMEALLRWHNPARGDISPAIFIPIAEDCGEIGGIGDWVLENACRDAATWSAPYIVSVNVSPVQILNQDLAKRIHEILLESGLPANRLEIEITETALVRDFDRAIHTLRRIKALGVRIAMDDFGTGYSSLYTLRSFPFDKIKIDGSFIRSVDSDAQSAAIVRAVIGLGRGLGMPILAESVETIAEFEFLFAAGCDAVQGHLIGKPDFYPAAVRDAGHWLDKSKNRAA